MVQMADGLAHLHSRDIIHRDIKPANVLIQKEDDGYPTAKLSDFGLSKILEADMLSTMNSDVGVAISTIGHDILEGFRDYLK